MATLTILVSMLALVGATKLADMDQGAEFTKCISIADFQSKTLDDDITLIDRVGGCCPQGSVPGAKWRSNYQGAQVVCGFKADGSVALSTGTTNGQKTCTYNKCYVDKQDLVCADGTKQLLNGCCAATTAANTGFGTDCKNYYYSFTNAWSESVKYCTTYHKNYGSIGYKGTTEKTDDQADGKLVHSKIRTYAPCGGGSGGPAPAPAANGAEGLRAVAAFASILALVFNYF